MASVLTQLSFEDSLKLDFMSEVEYIMQQVSNGHIGVAEGYEKLMNLLGEKELERILQILYRREKFRKKGIA